MNSTSPETIITIRPAPGRTIYDPQTRRQVTGEYRVVLDTHWMRRIKDGDVEVIP